MPDDPSIRLVALAGISDIGAKRNFAAGEAAGEIIVHFDDDDHSEPGRIEQQVRQLRQSGKAVTGYHAMRFTDGKQWWQYSSGQGYALGTSLCYRRDWWAAHPFRCIEYGEDGHFTEEAAWAGQLVAVDAGEMMHATIHQSNTCPRQLAGSRWRRVA